MNTVTALRQKHPRFIYESFHWEIKKRDLAMSFSFLLTPNIRFSPKVVIRDIDSRRVFGLAKKGVIDNFVFHMGLAEIPSYWKAAASPVIEIEAGYFDARQIHWWKKLLLKGMGEYFYVNRIDFTKPNFLTIKSHKSDKTNKSYQTHKADMSDRVLIPMGGGKDSIVTLEFLKQKGDVRTMMLNPTYRMKNIARLSKTGNPIIIERSIDPNLLILNKKGYLNGHTPFSSYLALTSVFCAALFDFRSIALSNERSANEGNVRWKRKVINHQYSKSYEFEKDFRVYSKKYLSSSITYYSYLRPFEELAIAKRFAPCTKYFPYVLSCNRGQKTGTWCLSCPKCLFVFLILYPFVDVSKLEEMFGSNLFEKGELLPMLEELAGTRAHKPFECVGTHREVREAIALSIEKYRSENLFKVLPALLLSAEKKFNLRAIPKRKYLILGFAREGQDVLKFFRSRFPDEKIGIADQFSFKKLSREARVSVKKHCKKPNLALHFGKNYLDAILQYDVIIKSPGIPLSKIPPLRKNQILTSETKIFFDLCPGYIIGVTGTKGKSTTAKLIYEVIKTKFPSAILVGNIGKPALCALPSIAVDTPVVYELSSFQLADLTRSPNIAVLLNIFPEHFDWHGNFLRYIRAKGNIVRFQRSNDAVIYDESNRIAKSLAQKSKGRKIPFICAQNKTSGKLPSFLNYKSVCAAHTIAEYFNIPRKTAAKTIRAFTGLPHRLCYVGMFRDIHFYNDSLATIPEATTHALKTLGNNVETLLLGGFDRGISFDGLRKTLQRSDVKNIILFPPSGKRIKEAIEKFQISSSPPSPSPPAGRAVLRPSARRSRPLARRSRRVSKFQFFETESMREAVRFAYKHTARGKICLLSPASPSFGIFKDYVERGTLFEKYVREFSSQNR